MVRVFIGNITALPDPLEAPWIMESLPQSRKEKVCRIRRVHERKQSLGAGLLLEYVKKQYIDVGFDSLNYNLSHSGDMVICAVSKEAVGCDIEQIKKAPLRVAERFFCKSEAEYLNNLESEAQNQYFYRFWTIKESFMKMHKKGLAMGLDSFEVCIDKDIKIKIKDEIQSCMIKEYDFYGYKISVCSEEWEFEKELIRVGLVDG